ncbi:amidohydrolase family protein [Robertkochia solimangrovi]|uniref:amidohydrolase family protein n=1 Tax=Robertkochia solimangrovi TaxID=2213046 RepID=UPI0011809EDC|nr:amidohydrolase family protein [Robertkochia solimangrovi]TRZ43604.1 amidohydrolase [Robertkochia solimangrovi]
MKIFKHTLKVCLALFSIALNAQQTPAPIQSESILITGATAHIGNGEIIENSAIGFADGKINFVGTAGSADKSAYSKVIAAEGKHVYPGFIALNTTLGLVEIDAVKATDDIDEVGAIIPNVRSLIAYNAESKVVETMRPNGVLMAQVAPRGSLITGTSSIVQLDAWNWEDAAIKTDDGIHMNWPSLYRRGRAWRGEDPGIKKNDEYESQIQKVKDFFAAAATYIKGDQSPRNLAYEAVQGLFDGTQKLYINAAQEKQLIDAMNFAKTIDGLKIVFIGGDGAVPVASQLRDNGIPVIVSRPHRIPSLEDMNVKEPYKLAGELVKEGVTVSIDVSGSMERMSTRNLPFYAGTFATYGMDKERALQMITLDAAKILGIDDFAGSLATGKDATLFICEGDALDMRSNQIPQAFIQGRDLSLETHQTTLWKRYSNKYAGQK